MLKEAYKRGFEIYCLSEHVPRLHASQLYPEEVQVGLTPLKLRTQFEEYLVEARQCASQWKGKMSVLVGAELENIDDGCIEYIQEVLEGVEGNQAKSGQSAGRGRIDFVIGSLHHVNSIPIDFDKATFEKSLDSFRLPGDQEATEITRLRRAHLRLILRYLDQQSHVLLHFQAEVIGHFDLCRLFLPDTPMTLAAAAASTSSSEDTVCSALLQQVDAAVRRNIDIVCGYKGLFEVNSASLRKGWSTPYPGEDVLDIILEKGGRLCLSDDAHSHEQVGLNFHRTKQYLEQKGVKEIWTLQPDDGTLLPDNATRFPRGTIAVKIADWTSNSFWHTANTPL